MGYKKYLFVDRDGTIIHEPPDQQIDTLEKLTLVDGVIPALLRLQAAGYRLVMVTNQDGLGTATYPQASWDLVQGRLMQLLSSQGIHFDEVVVCPHRDGDGCFCRKPNLGLVRKYLSEMDPDRSCVVGDRATDVTLAENMGIASFRLGPGVDWPRIADALVTMPRRAKATRRTKETEVEVEVELEGGPITVSTGIGYFDHMLEQIAKHGGFGLKLRTTGDLHVDEHHTVEDAALVLGEALRKALGDKIGIGRYGFVLPMDEAQARVAIDLSSRPYAVFEGRFPRETVGELPTELVPHFFRSLADTLGAAIHIEVRGENAHHMVEAVFKGVGRSLRAALARTGGNDLPSTKGAL